MTPAVALLAIHLLSGPLGVAPCTIILRVRVEPRKANRSIEVVLTSEAFSSASLQELHGLDAATTQRQQTYPDVPKGDYIIRATVQRSGQRAVMTQVPYLCE